jgi:PAS domain S-box-containing protein
LAGGAPLRSGLTVTRPTTAVRQDPSNTKDMATRVSTATNAFSLELQQERIFRVMVDSVRDYAIFLLDPSGVVASWNPGAQRLKQYTATEIIGRHFSVFYPEEEIANRKPDYELKVAARVGRFEDEGWRIRKDGSRFWANVVITRIADESGKLIGFGKITRDLTERRAAEQRYRQLVDSVHDYSIFSLDANGYVTSWNSGAQRIKQYTADEIIGQHFSKFYTREDAAAQMPQRVLQIARESGHYEGEGWRVRKDGTRFWSSIVVTPILDEDGRLIGFSKVTRDITDRKKLMDELQRHTEELEVQVAERERTNAELEAFSYSVSHDLRAPLRAIEGFANALREDYGEKLDPAAHEYLQQIMAASTRMNRLVRDLLEYGRLGRIELPQHSIAIRPLLHKLIQENFSGENVIVDVETSVSVLGHEPTLSQMLVNLISNGIKFQRPGVKPQVRISALRAANMVRISIADNGIGIHPQHVARLFNVFERLHGMEQYPGTGIGLAIVKRGSERMGGRCGVESKPGEGSTFWVELPEASRGSAKEND